MFRKAPTCSWTQCTGFCSSCAYVCCCVCVCVQKCQGCDFHHLDSSLSESCLPDSDFKAKLQPLCTRPTQATEPSTLTTFPSLMRMRCRLARIQSFLWKGGLGGGGCHVIRHGLLSEHQSGCPQILFPDGGEIGPLRPGPPQTLAAWRPPPIPYLMEVL